MRASRDARARQAASALGDVRFDSTSFSLVDVDREPAVEFIAPGHGLLIDEPNAVIDEYIHHRLEREQQVLAAVAAGDRTTGDIVSRLYVGLVDELVPRAKQSVHAHLRKLAAERRVVGEDVDDPETVWTDKSS